MLMTIEMCAMGKVQSWKDIKNTKKTIKVTADIICNFFEEQGLLSDKQKEKDKTYRQKLWKH